MIAVSKRISEYTKQQVATDKACWKNFARIFGHMTFRILSWNLLHTLESTRLKKFAYCKPESLFPKSRMGSVVRFVKQEAPDIALFQEVDANLMSLVEPGIEECLSRAHVSLNESLPAKDGLGIYYNPQRLQVVSTETVRFRNVVDRHLPELGKATRTSETPFSLTRALYREVREKLNMAILVRFSDLKSGKELMACSSHLFWDPAYPDIKLVQAYLLGKEIERVSQELPIVLGADLNSIPDSSAVYELLMGSGNVTKMHDHHPAKLRSASGNSRFEGVSSTHVPDLSISSPFRSGMREFFGREPEYTNYTKTFKGCLDYVMYRGDLSVASAKPLPDEAALSVETALPNSQYPSDHLPLVLDLKWS